MLNLICARRVARARKMHICADCLGVIRAGESYAFHVLADGASTPYRWNSCDTCAPWIAAMPYDWLPDEDTAGWVREVFDFHTLNLHTRTYEMPAVAEENT